ncbi:MAG: LamG-like jellyroll fold domain-containing protein [Candidatus Parvarchaeum sp.]
MQIGSKSQSSLEYLIVMGIAIFILAAAISYALYYQIGYNSAGTAQDLQLAATSIANAVNSLSGEGIGSSQQFSFSSPGLNIVSSICNNSLSLSFGGEEAAQSLSLYTTGELPISSGTFDGKVTLVKENGKPEAQISMNLPISYISTSYTYNPSSVFYNVSFLDTKGNLVGNVNFTLIIYNHNNIIAEQNESTLSGYYSGSITPSNGGQFSPGSTAEIYVRAFNIISPSCLLPQKLLIIPTNVLNFVPLTIKNSQSIATPSPFQQEVVVDSADYQQYEASNLQNVEFFYPNGTIINSWLESGNSNTATNSVYWLKLSGIPASSSITVYMGFASKSVNLFNNTNDGEAPQLSPTYGEYDNGANVFLNYFSGSSLTGWTTAGTSGQTTSAPSGSPFGTNAFYALNSVGSYLYTIAPGQSKNMIIEYYTYINRLNDIFFLVNSAGAGQLARQGDGGGWYGIASTSSWTSWNAPPDTGYWSGEWVLSGVVVNNGVAQQYLSTNLGTYGSEIGQNPSNTYTVSDNGNYLGLVGDGGGSSDEYWNGLIIRAYPPNGVMPSVTFGPVQPQITVFVNGVKDGNNGIAYGDITNITAFGTHASHIGLMINGSVVIPLGSASLSYQKPLSAGLYNITVFSNQSNLANQTYWEAVANVPKNVKDFVPISITNLQSSATSNVFQQNISVNSFDYNSLENKTLSNIEFFSPSGTVIPSWLESGDLAYFDGTNSYANLPENYPFSTASTFTISVWFKTTSDGVVLWNGNNEQVSSGGCYSPIIYVDSNGDLAGGDWTGSQPFVTNYFVANGKWNSVTIVQTPSEQILYLNGTEIATYSGTPQSCSPSYWTLGEGYTSGWTDTNGGNFYFNGYITNVQFYNQAFSPSKAALLYDEGIAGSPLNNSGLIAWYLLAGNGNEQNGNKDLSINNVQFNGVSAASTSTKYWLKLGTISPRESYIAFMGFALPNITLFNNTNDGEAPQLSSAYGEYDDGANVFNFYSNFAGTTLNTSQWTTPTIPYSVDNGLTLDVPSSSGAYGDIATVPTFSSGSVFDFYGEPTTNNGGGGFDFGVGDCINCNPSGDSWMLGASSGNSNYYLYLNDSTALTNYVRSYGVWTVGLELDGTTAFSEYNYGDEYTVTDSSFSPTPNNYLILIHNGDLGNTFIQWFLERTSPPNGVMPSVSFGSVS